MAVSQKQLLYDISIDTKSAVISINDLNKTLEALGETLGKQISNSLDKATKEMDGFGMTMAKMNQGLELMKKAWSFDLSINPASFFSMVFDN